MTTVRILERVSRHAALGIRLWDFATGNTVVEGLNVALFSCANPSARIALRSNRDGVYIAHKVPGLHDFEFSGEPPEVLWATPPKPFRVEVSDPAGRFLSSSFDVDLPIRHLFSLMMPWLSPGPAIPLPLESGSPSWPMVGVVPLFSAPERPLPEPLGVVYADLRLPDKRAAAAVLLAVAIDGKQRGLGLSDAHGRVAVFFGYPDPPRRQLLSPPEARNDFSWEVDLLAFRDGNLPASGLPDLARVLGQLLHPVAVLQSLHSPAHPLRLDYRVPLTARTEGAVGDDASYLFLAA